MMLPTVDMRDFQRRYEFSSQDLTVLVGEVFDVLWTVPADQAWRPILVQFINDDNVDHEIVTQVRMTGGLIIKLSRTAVVQSQTKIVFGQVLDGLIDQVPKRYTTRAPVPLEPGFQLQIVDLTTAVNPSSAQNVTIVYERVPQPATVLTSGPAAEIGRASCRERV